MSSATILGLRVRRGCASGASIFARPAETLEGDPATLIDEVWRPLASEQLERRMAGAHLTHGLVGLAHVSRRSKRLLGPLQSLLVDG